MKIKIEIMPDDITSIASDLQQVEKEEYTPLHPETVVFLQKALKTAGDKSIYLQEHINNISDATFEAVQLLNN